MNNALFSNLISKAKKLFYSASDSAGFTLLEVLIVVVVLLLIMGGGMASYISFNDRQVILNDARKFQTLIRSAQTKARVGDRPDSCQTLQGYSVRMAAGSSDIDILALCEDDQEVIRDQDSLSSSITAGSAVDITFYVLQGGAKDDVTVNLVSDDGREYRFDVNKGGDLSAGQLYDADEVPSPLPSVSPEASPNVTPTPSTNPNSLVILNAGGSISCDQACENANFTGCWSVGTDLDGSNGKSYSAFGFGEYSTCYLSTSSCLQVMTNRDNTCQGASANWTYCHCYKAQ